MVDGVNLSRVAYVTGAFGDGCAAVRAALFLARGLAHAGSALPLVMLVDADKGRQARRCVDEEDSAVAKRLDSGRLVLHENKWSYHLDCLVDAEPRAAAAWQQAVKKLELWELSAYDRLLWIDSDVAVVRNPDAIFRDYAASTAALVGGGEPAPPREGVPSNLMVHMLEEATDCDAPAPT